MLSYLNSKRYSLNIQTWVLSLEDSGIPPGQHDQGAFSQPGYGVSMAVASHTTSPAVHQDIAITSIWETNHNIRRCGRRLLSRFFIKFQPWSICLHCIDILWIKKKDYNNFSTCRKKLKPYSSYLQRSVTQKSLSTWGLSTIICKIKT